MMKKIRNYFYYLCEHYGSKVNNYGWHKRWNKKYHGKRNRN